MTTTSLTHVWWLSLSNHKRKVVSKLTYFSCCFDQIIRSDKFFANDISSQRGNSLEAKVKLECTISCLIFDRNSTFQCHNTYSINNWSDMNKRSINSKYTSLNWNHEIILLKYFCCVKNLLKCQVFILEWHANLKHAIYFACYTWVTTKLIEFSLIVQTSYNKIENYIWE